MSLIDHRTRYEFAYTFTMLFDGVENWAFLEVIKPEGGIVCDRFRINRSPTWKADCFQAFIQRGAVASIQVQMLAEADLREKAAKTAESWDLCRSVILKYGFSPFYRADESAGKLHVTFPAKGDARVVNFAPTATTLVEAADQIAKAGLNAVVDNREEAGAIVWRTLALMVEARCAARGLSIFDFKFSVQDSGHPILLRLDGARIADSVKCKETLRITTLPIIGSMIDSFLDRYSSKNACEPSSNSKPC